MCIRAALGMHSRGKELIDFLNDEQVLKKLKQVLFLQALADKIDNMKMNS